MSDNYEKSNKTAHHNLRSCSSVTYQSATVSVPVTVKPRVITGSANTFCCGNPVITPSSCTIKYSGKTNGSCNYVITQNICVEVPIEFSANAFVGAPCVKCGNVTGKDICNDCKK